MTLKNVLKSMAVVGAVAIAAPSAYAQDAYTTIGAEENGPIFPVYGETAAPVYSETSGTVSGEAPAVSVAASYPDDGYTNIGNDSGGPVADLYVDPRPEYGPAEELDIYDASTGTIAPLGYSEPTASFEPFAYVGLTTPSEQPVYYMPVRGEQGSPLVAVYR